MRHFDEQTDFHCSGRRSSKFGHDHQSVNTHFKSRDYLTPTEPNLSIDGCKTFLSYDIPSLFNYGHIYYHLVESISDFPFVESVDDAEDLDSGYTTTIKPLRKGLSLLNSGFVRDIQDNIFGDIYYLRTEAFDC